MKTFALLLFSLSWDKLLCPLFQTTALCLAPVSSKNTWCCFHSTRRFNLTVVSPALSFKLRREKEKTVTTFLTKFIQNYWTEISVCCYACLHWLDLMYIRQYRTVTGVINLRRLKKVVKEHADMTKKQLAQCKAQLDIKQNETDRTKKTEVKTKWVSPGVRQREDICNCAVTFENVANWKNLSQPHLSLSIQKQLSY